MTEEVSPQLNVVRGISSAGGADEPGDQALAEMAKNGDDNAFTLLVSRYVLTVKARAAGYDGTDIEPEDLVQEGLIGLMGAIRGYDPACGVSFKTFAWLCIDRSIISAVRATLRKKQIPRFSLVSIDDGWDAAPGIPPEKDDPEAVVIAREDLERFWARIRTVLSGFEREVLRLYLSGRNYQAIARQLGAGTSAKSVDNALSRIRRKLRRNQ